MVVATGFFDGVHLGHRRVISTLVEAARSRGEESLVVTFWPHPRNVLQKDARNLRLLSSSSEKRKMLEDLGVDRVEVVEFTREFSTLTAEEYLRDYVKGRFGGTAILLGYGNRIGGDGRNPEEIGVIAEGLGLEVIRTGVVSGEPGTAVSSSKIPLGHCLTESSIKGSLSGQGIALMSSSEYFIFISHGKAMRWRSSE